MCDHGRQRFQDQGIPPARRFDGGPEFACEQDMENVKQSDRDSYGDLSPVMSDRRPGNTESQRSRSMIEKEAVAQIVNLYCVWQDCHKSRDKIRLTYALTVLSLRCG